MKCVKLVTTHYEAYHVHHIPTLLGTRQPYTQLLLA
jgi:hypothetical protein